MTDSITIPVAKPRLPPLEALAPYIARIDAARRYSNHGPLNDELEARLAARYGVPPEGVSTLSNATVGLALGLRAAGAQAAGFCLLPSWTFSATVHAAVDAGLTPLFVDVAEDGTLTPQIAREALDVAPGHVGGVMPVAVCGQPIDPAPWVRFAQETGVPVVVDAAPAFDSAQASPLVTAVSLHATKMLGVGEGGFVMGSDIALVADVRRRANFGFEGSREALALGTNGKISEYAAAVGLAGLDGWAERRAAFEAVAQRYRAALAQVPGARLSGGWGDAWLSATCIVHLDQPAAPLARDLAAEGVDTRAWWGEGMHHHRAFAHFPRLRLPVTRRLAERTLGLPFFIDMTPAEVDRVCETLGRAMLRRRADDAA